MERCPLFLMSRILLNVTTLILQHLSKRYSLELDDVISLFNHRNNRFFVRLIEK